MCRMTVIAQYRMAMQVCNADVSSGIVIVHGDTHHAEGADKFIRWRVVLRDHFRDEVRSHANAAEEADYLEQADNLECCSESTIVRSSHFEKVGV